jgi:predicted XRE-type DNA-binding protein
VESDVGPGFHPAAGFLAGVLRSVAKRRAEAANRCGITQPRISDLIRGRVSRFSLDALVNIATALGCRVRVDLEAA